MGDSHVIDDARRVQSEARAVSVDFLMQELELGLTFCGIALGAHSKGDYEEHRADAEKAYKTALRYVQALELTDAECKLFEQKEQELRWLLGKLNEETR
jgi:hypothetical protein